MATVKINVFQTVANRFIASFDHSPGTWEIGNTDFEAIGKLVWTAFKAREHGIDYGVNLIIDNSSVNSNDGGKQ